MEPSEEVRQVVTRFFQALRDGDEDAIVSRISREPGFERLGSDQTERWHDGDAAPLVWPQQVREMGGGYPWKLIDDVRAMSEGSVGWATARTELEAPEGPFEMRFTCVLRLEHGEWKLVQWHSSVPVSNERMGWFLTTTVDQIAQDISEARPDLSVTSASDGTVTIVFTDIEDSLQLNAFLGDRRWLEVLTAHNELVTHAVADNGGIVVKNQGDGFMLAFASARRALRCARAIERAVGETFRDPGSPIRVRIGLHIGEPVREEADFFGHAVGYAARVASSAAGGEVVVSRLLHDMLVQTGEVEFGEPREVQLKGIDGPQMVFPLAVP